MTLNDYVRRHSRPLAEHGVHALPTRYASPILRRCQNDDLPIEDRKAEFDTATAHKTVVLAGLNVFGPAEAMLAEGAFLPDISPGLCRLGEIAGPCRVVMALDPLPYLFNAPATDRLSERVRPIGWETLFEMSWLGVLTAVSEAIPDADILVLTSQGMALRSGEVLERLFGPVGPHVDDPHWLLRQVVTETGHAVLDRLLAKGPISPDILEEFCAFFVAKPDAGDIEARFGIEKITLTLMEQRFEEDLEKIAKLPRTEII